MGFAKKYIRCSLYNNKSKPNQAQAYNRFHSVGVDTFLNSETAAVRKKKTTRETAALVAERVMLFNKLGLIYHLNAIISTGGILFRWLIRIEIVISLNSPSLQLIILDRERKKGIRIMTQSRILIWQKFDNVYIMIFMYVNVMHVEDFLQIIIIINDFL